MTQPIDELLRSAGVLFFDASDGTLSGGEAASASIVSALVERFETGSTGNNNEHS